MSNRRIEDFIFDPSTMFHQQLLMPSTISQTTPSSVKIHHQMNPKTPGPRRTRSYTNVHSILITVLCCLCLSTSFVKAWDPNEHQINTVETHFYVSENRHENSLVYSLRDSMSWVGQPYQYSMRDPNSHFDIDNEGRITLIKLIDYEKTSQEKFVVSVFNTQTNIQEYYVNVIADVFDENEATPTFIPPTIEVEFDHFPETGEFIAQVQATDEDTEDIPRLRFSIKDDRFAIDQRSGKITAASSLESYYTTPTRPRPFSSGVEPTFQPMEHFKRLTKIELKVFVSDGQKSNPGLVIITIHHPQESSFEAISAEAEPSEPVNPRIVHRTSQQNDLSTLMIASLQSPEVMIVIGLAGILLVVVIVAGITTMVCINRSNRFSNGMRPNRVYYYGNGTNGQQPPSTTNSQNITQSLYIYGDGGRLNNNRDMRDYMRP